LPESQAELGGPGHGTGVWTEDVGNRDIFGVGLIMGKSTKEDVETYFGKPFKEKLINNGFLTLYKYKNDICITIHYILESKEINAIFIDDGFGYENS
jgi:hypothetical protein